MFPSIPNSQLQMTALSRNTASVAQDFHNAGGRDKAIIDKFINSNNNNQPNKKSLMNDDASPNHQCSSIEANQPFNVNAYVFSTSIDDFTSDTQSMDSIDDSTTMTTHKNVSPPAVQRSSTAATTPNAKKRRQHLIDEKENEMMFADSTIRPHKQKTPSRSTSAAHDWKHIRPRSLETEPSRMPPSKCTDENCEKTEQPICDRPSDLPTINRINAIRYKHLVRMVSKKESCKSCQRHAHCMVLAHHTKRSLTIHRILWHSDQGNYDCIKCGHPFKKKYKRILHMQLSQRCNWVEMQHAVCYEWPSNRFEVHLARQMNSAHEKTAARIMDHFPFSN